MKNWYENNLKLFFSILILAPFGVYGLIKRNTKKNTLKIIALIVSIFYSIFWFLMLIGIIVSLTLGTDKISFDNGNSNFEKQQYEKAKKDFEDIDSKSEYYIKAKAKIAEINKIFEDEKLHQQQKLAEEEKLREKIVALRVFWSDSVVKSWNGQFIVEYKKPISDTIYFYLSKGASKTFNSNREDNLPIYANSYKSSMQSKLGKDYSDNVQIEFIQNEDSKRENEIANQRRELIERQFGWKGQHRNLEDAIKESMNDPDSYEHVKTVWNDKGSYILIQTTIRETNAFGAKIIKTYTAKADINGNMFEIK